MFAGYLRQSTAVDIVLGPVWDTTTGALKSDLAYNASGINCDLYKNGTKTDVSLASGAGDGYFRAGSGEAQYILTLSTTSTDTIGRARITLSATGYYAAPIQYVVLDEAVYDQLFGTVALDAATLAILGTPVNTGGAATLAAILGNPSNVSLASSAASILEDTGTTLDTLVKDLPTNAELATALGTADDAVLVAVAAVKAETALIAADTNELQTDWANGGRLDLQLDAAAANSGAAGDTQITQASEDDDGDVIGITTAGAHITAYLSSDTGRGTALRYTTAEADGEWAIGLTPGATYTLVFAKDGYAETTREVTV